MRHRKKTIKLGRTSAHREALMASLVCHLIIQKRIKTTLAKAKAARSLADKMVTLGKRGDLAARRLALAKLRKTEPVAILFKDVAPQFKDRPGGYTRILKLGRRVGDNSELALLEWVESDVAAKPAPKAKKSKAASKPASKAETKDEAPKAAKKVKAAKKPATEKSDSKDAVASAEPKKKKA